MVQEFAKENNVNIAEGTTLGMKTKEKVAFNNKIIKTYSLKSWNRENHSLLRN